MIELSKVELCGTQSGRNPLHLYRRRATVRPLRDECQHRAVAVEVPAEYTRRREVFGAVKSICFLFPVNEIAIPNGIAQEKPVRLRLYGWYVGM